MRLVTFVRDGAARCGVRRGESIVDLTVAAPDLPGDWPAIFAAGAMDRVAAAVQAAKDSALVPAASVSLLPPIPNPPKLPCIGLNYRSHAEEAGMAIPDYPIVFPRWPGSMVGHDAPIVCPRASGNFDYEAELAIVIGMAGRHIPKAKALDHVAGYACFNDGSLRDYQFKSSQWAMGKNFDASGSFGPDIVTADELSPGAAGLRIVCRLNGETLQDGNTDDMIFDTATLVSILSEVMTLEPGDVIPTGTPPGVGFARKPPVWMKPGDVCEIEIEKIGVLRNKVVVEG
jgi:acylpyruvate hydrolase